MIEACDRAALRDSLAARIFAPLDSGHVANLKQ
jgi:hypothetical protein